MTAPVKVPANSRKARAEETRRRLIEVAMEHFSERHYDEVAASDIAQSAGVAHGLLFHHFGSKRGIYLEVMRKAAADLDQAGSIPPDGPIGRQFRLLLTRHLEYLAKHKGLARQLVLGGRGADPEAWELFEANRWRAIEWFCLAVDLNPESDALRLTLRASSSAIDEASAYWLEHDRCFEISALVETFIDLTVYALRAAARLEPEFDVKKAIAQLRRA
jgi:AcrR family transcriptional regulator